MIRAEQINIFKTPETSDFRDRKTERRGGGQTASSAATGNSFGEFDLFVWLNEVFSDDARRFLSGHVVTGSFSVLVEGGQVGDGPPV